MENIYADKGESRMLIVNEEDNNEWLEDEDGSGSSDSMDEPLLSYGSSSGSGSEMHDAPTPEPTTETPVTTAPVTATPVTATPVTEAPVTETPVTETPVTPTPTITPAPTNATTQLPTPAPTILETPVPMPATTSPRTPRPSLPPLEKLTPPPVPPPASTCVKEKCGAKMDACMELFDSCACYPGLIKCATIKCLDDSDDVQADCDALQSSATVCSLTCSSAPFPTARGAKNVLSVESTCEIAGVSKDDFVANFQDDFIDVTAEIAKVDAEKVTILAIIENAARRLLAVRQLATGILEIDFSIEVDTPEKLKETQGELIAELDKTQSSDAGPSVFAKKLFDKGVITNVDQFTVTESKTVVTVEAAEDDEEYEEEAKAEDEKDGPPIGAIAGGAAAGAVLLLVIVYCLCKRK